MINKLINLGFGNMVSLNQVVAIISPNSAPVKRLKDEAKDASRLIDVTQGRRTRSIIVTSSNHVLLSSVQVETLANRFQAATAANAQNLKSEVEI